MLDLNEKDSEQDELLRAPKMPRTLRFKKWQWVMIPLLLAIPILALTKSLGGAKSNSSVSTSSVELSVEYPKSIRHGQSEAIKVALKNPSSQVIRDLRVELSSEYLDRFSDIQSAPAPSESPNQIALGDLASGGQRQAVINLRAEAYGRHSGAVTVFGNGAELARVSLQSLVFP